VVEVIENSAAAAAVAAAMLYLVGVARFEKEQHQIVVAVEFVLDIALEKTFVFDYYLKYHQIEKKEQKMKTVEHNPDFLDRLKRKRKKHHLFGDRLDAPYSCCGFVVLLDGFHHYHVAQRSH
jgi:uncharacterized protein YpiB (UPF0302 family)